MVGQDKGMCIRGSNGFIVLRNSMHIRSSGVQVTQQDIKYKAFFMCIKKTQI